MPSTAIINVGTLISGNIQQPILDADSILIENDKIAAIGLSDAQIKGASQIIDAVGMTLIPGLIDSHTHPAIGDYTPGKQTAGAESHDLARRTPRAGTPA